MIRSVEMWLSLALIVFVALYALVPSEALLRFHSIRIEGGYIHKVRDVPFGAVTATWTEKLTTPDGKVCPDSGSSGKSTYEERRNVAGALQEMRYALGAMAPCAVPGAEYVSEHRVILGGWLPLRPVYEFHKIPEVTQ